MTIPQAIIIVTLLLAAAGGAAVLYSIRFRLMAHACMAVVLSAFSIDLLLSAGGWQAPYLAHADGTNVHGRDCLSIKAAIASGEPLDEYWSIDEARRHNLRPHYCISENKMYVATHAVTSKATSILGVER